MLGWNTSFCEMNECNLLKNNLIIEGLTFSCLPWRLNQERFGLPLIGMNTTCLKKYAFDDDFSETADQGRKKGLSKAASQGTAPSVLRQMFHPRYRSHGQIGCKEPVELTTILGPPPFSPRCHQRGFLFPAPFYTSRLLLLIRLCHPASPWTTAGWWSWWQERQPGRCISCQTRPGTESPAGGSVPKFPPPRKQSVHWRCARNDRECALGEAAICIFMAIYGTARGLPGFG